MSNDHHEVPDVALVNGAHMRLHQRGSEHEFWQVTNADHVLVDRAHAAGHDDEGKPVEGLDRTDDWLTYLGRRIRPAG